MKENFHYFFFFRRFSSPSFPRLAVKLQNAKGEKRRGFFFFFFFSKTPVRESTAAGWFFSWYPWGKKACFLPSLFSSSFLPNFCCKRSSEGEKEYQTPELSSPHFFLENKIFPVSFFFAQSSGKYISGQINGRIPNTSYGVYIFLHSAFHQAKPKNLLAIRRGRRNALQQKRRKSLSFLSHIWCCAIFLSDRSIRSLDPTSPPFSNSLSFCHD